MEGPMIQRSLPFDPTSEHRLPPAKWARGIRIVYGTILLLLALWPALLVAALVAFII
jgi:hypothetical protein